MRIFVFGNINAGKTHFISYLRNELFKEMTVLSIDQYRIKYGNNSWEKELYAQEQFTIDVSKHKNCIVECTGMGPLGSKIHDVIQYKNDIILYINTPTEICLKRIKEKDFSKIPYPKVDEKIEDTIIRCGREFENGDLYKLWKDKVLQVFQIKSINDLENVPFETISVFSDFVNSLYEKKFIKTIYIYGSLARNEMKVLSDIDCYIVTKTSVDKMRDLLEGIKKQLVYDKIGNKITVRDINGKLMIEFLILNKLSEGSRFIKGSYLSNLHDSIIKIDKQDLNYINNLKINNDEPIDSLKYLVSEISYFIKSLPKLIQEKNKYKYYFHSNIIVHNYIRINEILKDNIKFNHLPYVNYEDYKELIELDFNDLNEHYLKIKELVDNLLCKII